MMADSLLLPECVFHSGTLGGLMTLYESNFIKLTQLIENMESLLLGNSNKYTSYTDLDCDLHMAIIKKERYTTTLTLTYEFSIDNGKGFSESVLDPDLTIRIYHDAKLVDVVDSTNISKHQHRKLHEISQLQSHELSARWKRNMMLNKWLDYLLDMEHSFSGFMNE